MKFYQTTRIFVALALTVLVLGCSSGTQSTLPKIPLPDLSLPDVTHAKLPFVHRIDIQQGNVITQEMVAQLEIGMDKRKVRYVMGTPIIRDTFNADRWDYIYTHQEAGEDLERRQITLYFENHLLSAIAGDVRPAEGRLVVDTRQDTTVNVPGVYRKGFFAKVKDSMPLIGKDEEETSEDEAEESASDDTPQTASPAQRTLEDEEEPGELVESDETIASTEEVVVPAGEPKKKKRGFFKRIFDGVGLGAEEDDEDEIEYDTADPRYRNPAPQDEL